MFPANFDVTRFKHGRMLMQNSYYAAKRNLSCPSTARKKPFSLNQHLKDGVS
jgi:hypothetical protein